MGPIASGTGLFSACPRGAQPRHEVGQFLLLLAELTFNPIRSAESPFSSTFSPSHALALKLGGNLRVKSLSQV